MLMHHTLECTKCRLNPESYWLVNGLFLLTESFVEIICLVWQVCDVPTLPRSFVNPFLVVHPRVHRAHWVVEERWSRVGVRK